MSNYIYSAPTVYLYILVQELKGLQMKKMSNNKIYFVVGNIGSGKTQLLNIARNIDTCLESINEERVAEWGKYFEEFCQDMKRNRLSFNKFVLADMFAHLHRVLGATSGDETRSLLFERSPLCTFGIFSDASFYDNDSTAIAEICDHYKSHMSVFLNAHPSFTFHFIYVRVSPKRCMERIKKRARNGEENVSLEYLTQLHNLHERHYNNVVCNFGEQLCPVTIIDNETDVYDNLERAITNLVGTETVV